MGRGALSAAIAVLWLIGGALAPYIVAGVAAYLLTPVVDRMERWGINRAAATVEDAEEPMLRERPR